MALAALPVAGLNFDLLVLGCDCINTLFVILGLCGKISWWMELFFFFFLGGGGGGWDFSELNSEGGKFQMILNAYWLVIEQ